MTDRELMQQALEALEFHVKNADEIEEIDLVLVTALRERLAQPEQEPVATLWQHGETGRTRITMPDDITDCDARWFKAADLYTTPPQRKPLSPQSPCEMTQAERKMFRLGWLECEAAHGIGEKPDAA